MSNTYIPIIDADTGAIVKVPVQVLSDLSADFSFLGVRKLATVDLVDLNTASNTLLYTVPRERSCIITHIVQRKASISLTTNSWSCGWTSAAYTDVLATATHTELTGPTLATVLLAKIGEFIGVALATLYLKNNINQGAAATASFDIFGFLF